MATAERMRFYNSKRWETCRDQVMKRDLYLCQRCGKPAQEVHHIQYLTDENINDDSIAVNPDNLVSLCRECHFAVHEEMKLEALAIRNGFTKRNRILDKSGMYFDDNGMYQPAKVVIVYGAPASGKSTYVKEHKEKYDMVIDVDEIARALCLNDDVEANQNVRYLALDVRDYLFNLIESRHKNIDCHTFWVIDSLPEKTKREELAKRLNAELIFMDTDKETCLKRAEQRDRYPNNAGYEQWLVNQWFAKHTG